jgi:rod shape-determining protein MreD
LAAALLAQIEIAPLFRFRHAEVSVVLVTVVWYAMRVDTRRALLYGLIAGLCEDLLATGTGAAWTIATSVTAILAGAVSRGFFADSIAIVAGLVALATLVRDLVFWIVMALQGYPPGLAGTHFHQSVWQAILDALFVTVVMLLLRYRERATTR